MKGTLKMCFQVGNEILIPVQYTFRNRYYNSKSGVENAFHLKRCTSTNSNIKKYLLLLMIHLSYVHTCILINLCTLVVYYVVLNLFSLFYTCTKLLLLLHHQSLVLYSPLSFIPNHFKNCYIPKVHLKQIWAM